MQDNVLDAYNRFLTESSNLEKFNDFYQSWENSDKELLEILNGAYVLLEKRVSDAQGDFEGDFDDYETSPVLLEQDIQYTSGKVWCGG